MEVGTRAHPVHGAPILLGRLLPKSGLRHTPLDGRASAPAVRMSGAMKSLAREADQAELLQRLRTVSPESRARWGRMSAHQMVCHVADAFRMALGEKPCRPTAGWVGRTVLKWTALYAPLPWPAGIATSAEIDQQQAGTRPSDFAADVERAAALLGLAARPLPTPRPPHPVFGPLSEPAWFRWGYLHTDHHLRQFGA